MTNDKKSLWSRLLPIPLGIAMLVGAWLVISKPAATFQGLSTIIGVMLLLRGLAGMIRFYHHRETSGFKEKAELGLAVFLLIIGLVLLFVPGMLGGAIKWLTAAAFAVTAVKSLWASQSLRQKYPRASTLSLVLNFLLLLVSVLIAAGPLPDLFTFPTLIAAALILEGIDLIVLALLKK